MARFERNKADKFGGGGNQAGWLSLPNDKDSVRVRFMYKSLDDIMGYSVHEAQVNGKNRYVNCLRDYNDPVDACPFCDDNIPVRVKFFLVVLNIDTKEVLIWDRGKQFIPVLEDALEDLDGDISEHIFKITRWGKPKSTKTTYTLKHLKHTPKAKLAALTKQYELPKIMGGLILDKSYEELEDYLETGEFEDEQEQSTSRGNGRVAKRRPARGESRKSTSKKRKQVEEDEDFDDEDDDFDIGIESDELPFGDDEDDLDDFDGGVDDDFEDDDLQDEDDDFEDDEDDDFEDDDFEEEKPSKPARGGRSTEKPKRGSRGGTARPSRGKRNSNF